MSWAYPVGELFGVPVRVHVTFILLAVAGGLELALSHGLVGALFALVVVALFAVCVLLHELAHAGVAALFGAPPISTVLLPLGGTTRFARSLGPLEEIAVYAAGPIASFAVAVALAVGLALSGTTVPEPTEWAFEPDTLGLVMALVFANVMLAMINVLPLHPLDGARVLRGVLALIIGADRAAVATAMLGQVLAGSAVIFLLTKGRLLDAALAGLLFFAATRERAEGRARQVLGRFRAGQLCELAAGLSPGTPLSELGETMPSRREHAFPVRLGEQLLGVVLRRELLEALRDLEEYPYVASVMRRRVLRVSSDLPADELLRTMRTLGEPVVAVMEREELLGLLTEDRMLEIVGAG